MWVPMGLVGLTIYVNYGWVAALLALVYGLMCVVFTMLYVESHETGDAL